MDTPPLKISVAQGGAICLLYDCNLTLLVQQAGAALLFLFFAGGWLPAACVPASMRPRDGKRRSWSFLFSSAVIFEHACMLNQARRGRKRRAVYCSLTGVNLKATAIDAPSGVRVPCRRSLSLSLGGGGVVLNLHLQ